MMRAPMVRVDVAFYWILIAFLCTVLWTQKGQIQMLKDEVSFISKRLDNSMFIDTKKWEKEEDAKLNTIPNPD